MPTVPLAVSLSTLLILVALVSVLVAFLPTYFSGVDSVQDTTAQLRASIRGRILEKTTTFFVQPQLALDAVEGLRKSGMFDPESKSPTETIAAWCGVLRNNPSITDLQAVYPFSDRYESCRRNENEFNGGAINLTDQTVTHYVLDENFAQTDVVSHKYPMPLAVITTFKPFIEVLSGDRWTTPYGGPTGFVMTAGISYKDHLGNDGGCYTRVYPHVLGDFMNTAGLRENGRAIVAHRDTRYVIANSWGEEVFKRLWNFEDLSAPISERLVYKTPETFNDPTFKSAISNLGGDAALFAESSNRATMEFGSGKDRVLIDVLRISDVFGLDIVVVIVQKEIDFTKDIYTTREKTIGGIVGALVVVVLVSIVLSFLFARPLKDLKESMHKTATLQDVPDDNSRSMIAEVAGMQEAYVMMKNELSRMKSFLPESVLRAHFGEDGDEEDDEGDASDDNAFSASHHSDHECKVSVTSSGKGSKSSSMAKPMGGLNLSSGSTLRKICVAALNIRGFHKITAKTSSYAILGFQAAYLTAVQTASRAHKGVIDFFEGDRIFVTFNAVHFTAAPAKRGCLAMIEARKECALQFRSLLKDEYIPDVSVGLSYGPALVGNMGISSMMRFNSIGQVFTNAATLQQLTKQWYQGQLPILFSGSMVEEVEHEVHYQVVDIIKFNNEDTAATALCSLEGAKGDVISDEWMYELQKQKGGDIFAQINDGFSAFRLGNLSAAATVVADTLTVTPLRGMLRLKDLVDMVDGDSAKAECYARLVVPFGE